jgi:quercetin dioxygenase-like cupin family protein
MFDRPQPTIVDPAAGATYRVLGDAVTIKAGAADTNGSYALFEIRTPPGGGMPRHRQRYDDEAWWVLDGSYTVELNDRALTLHAGSYAYVPRGAVHGYHNHGDTPARMLIVVTPGGIHERFYAQVDARLDDRSAPPAPGGSVELPRLTRIAQQYGIELLPP